ncbi:MAG: hypothetical protein GF411_03010 [Candidatus Lokiarchaeota archaeon]|nr:hypothetical protein [Candidatus Lokiarchaeota archaeon]
MPIHVLTSYKGGTGKTSIALAIAIYCIENNINFTLIDTNPQNSNIAEDIFFYFHVDHVTSDVPWIFKQKTVYTLSPDSSSIFTIIDGTNCDPYSVVDYLQRSSDDPNHVYVIDTNVHIRSCPEQLLSQDAIHNTYVWFLWGWSSPRLDHQLHSILEASKRIEQTWPKSQVIHVFNLYDFYTSGLQLFGFRKASTTLRPLKKVLKRLDKKVKRFTESKCKPTYIDYDFLSIIMKELHGTLVRFVSDDSSLQELPILWGTHLMDIMERTKRDYPYNILLIPTFFRELTMSVDRLIMSAPRRFDTIHQLIKPMADYINVFLCNLASCSDIRFARDHYLS